MEQPNLDYINQLSGDNEEFKNKLIGILKKELPLEIAGYKSDLLTDDLALASQSVHKIKHKVSILGLEKSYYIASTYENNLKLNSFDLKDEFENILKIMQEYVDSL
ncbi:Hpt domain-containing protein [Flavobacterium faecale]|uniref:Hpt domain-containing protein n=1 Tax=Flavobacterium faecale TaxID=1355330 RepID=UPI003AAE9802